MAIFDESDEEYYDWESSYWNQNDSNSNNSDDWSWVSSSGSSNSSDSSSTLKDVFSAIGNVLKVGAPIAQSLLSQQTSQQQTPVVSYQSNSSSLLQSLQNQVGSMLQNQQALPINALNTQLSSQISQISQTSQTQKVDNLTDWIKENWIFLAVLVVLYGILR